MNDKYNIFISFAHVDNEPFLGVEHGWVTYLFRALTATLNARPGNVNITSRWPAVQSSGQEGPASSEQVRGYIEQAQAFLVILSPGWLASELCHKELDLFLKNSEKPGSCVIVAEKTQIKPEAFPEPLKPYKRYQFWSMERSRPRTMATPKPDHRDVLFYQKVDDLAQDLADTLRRFSEQVDIYTVYGAQKKSALSRLPTATVYLAETGQDLKDDSDSVRRYLRQFHIRVLPDPEDLTPEQALDKSDLFVQLLSDTEDQAQWAQAQYRAAAAHNLPVLQWRHPHPDISQVSDPALRSMLQAATVRAVNLEEFKLLVRQRLTEKPAQAAQPEQFVFLNASEEDQRLARSIGNIIRQLGLSWHMRQDEGAPHEIRTRLDSELSHCNGLLVFYGRISATWVKSQFVYLRRVRRPPLPRAMGLYQAPPENKPDVDIPVPGVTVLDCRKGIDEVKLRKFLEPLIEY